MSRPTQTPAPDPTDAPPTRPGGGGAGRTVATYVVAALAPLAAWLVWVSPTDETSDQQSIAWFVTVALACVVAGALAPPRWEHRIPLAASAVIMSLVTLFVWWSSEDESGLFLVGLIIAAPPMTLAAPALLLLGGALARVGRG